MANDLLQKAAAAKTPAATGRKTITDLLKAMEPEIKKALPSVITPERFTRIAMTALSSNQKLQECTPMSFIGTVMTGAQLGLELNTPLGQCYAIPFRNHGVMECQFQLGYKGLLDLCYRSGEVSTIQCHTVYENDDFSYELGLEPKLIHKPATSDRGAATHYYAVVRMKDGGYNFAVMSHADALAHAQKYSKSYTSGPWQTNFDEMARKTVLKQCLKYCPMKTDFVRATVQDETIKTEISAEMYTVNDVTEYSDIIDVDESTGEVVDNG